QLVADTLLIVEISAEKLALFFFRQECKRLGRSVCQSSSDAQESLKLAAGIDKHANLSFLRLAHRFERERVSARNPVISFCSRRIDRDLFPGRGKSRRLLRSLEAVVLFVGAKRKLV